MRLAVLFVLSGLAIPGRGQVLAPATKQLPITAPVRDAGILHLASGTWTRNASATALGLDTICDTTCFTGYYSPLVDDMYVHDVRIPSPTGPTNLNSRPGCATSYLIDGFQIAYCTDQTVVPSYTIQFFQRHVPCSSVIGVTPEGRFVLTGLPASSAQGVQACWSVTIDLESPPQSASLAFTMLADGDGTYGTSPDTFGWSMGTNAAGTATGPIIAGGFSCLNCSGFDGTRWDPVVDYSEEGGGMGNQGLIRIEGGSTFPGCYFLQCPDASFHLELYADACGAVTGEPFCFGDGSGTPCPCGNASPLGNHEGCRSSASSTNGAKLVASGTASISADSLVLAGSQMPATSTVLYFQGTTRQNGGLGSVLGDGLRCAGGTTSRLGRKTNVGGASQYPVAGDPSVSVQGGVTSPGTRTYQVWYRNSAAFCTPATYNLSNGWEVVWGT